MSGDPVAVQFQNEGKCGLNIYIDKNLIHCECKTKDERERLKKSIDSYKDALKSLQNVSDRTHTDEHDGHIYTPATTHPQIPKVRPLSAKRKGWI